MQPNATGEFEQLESLRTDLVKIVTIEFSAGISYVLQNKVISTTSKGVSNVLTNKYRHYLTRR